MIEFNGYGFICNLLLLREMQGDLARGAYGEQAGTALSEGYNKTLIHLVGELEDGCDALAMSSASLAARTLINQMCDHPYPVCSYLSAYTGLYALLSQLSLELSKQRFAYIPADRHRYFTQENLFGLHVPSQFPSADQDSRDAGNAYAAGLHIAAVFHLMRVAEIGLRLFAKHLRVGLHKTKGPIEWVQWEDILAAITNKVEDRAKGAKKTKPVKAADRAFYRGVLAEFQGFKDMYRNDVMHVRAVYHQHEAASAIDKVGGFMRRLGTRVHE